MLRAAPGIRTGACAVLICGLAAVLAHLLGNPVAWFLLATTAISLRLGSRQGLIAIVVCSVALCVLGASTLETDNTWLDTAAELAFFIVAASATNRLVRKTLAAASHGDQALLQRPLAPADRELSELRELAESLSTFTWEAGADGRVDFISQGLLDLLGRRVEAVASFQWTNVLHPDDAERTLDVWLHAIRNGTRHDVVLRARGADGAYRWLRVAALPARDTSGRIDRWYGIAMDVSAQRRVEEALLASEASELALRGTEQQLRGVIDGVPGMLCVCAPDGELEYVNQPMLDLIGHSLEESKRFGWASTIHPADREALVQSWIAATQSGKLLDYEYRRLCPDAVYRWFHVRMKPQLDAQGGISRWFALITDIHARRTAEEARRESEQEFRQLGDALRRAQERIARAARAATVAELSASIAHEVNQPLAAVVANAEACQHWLANEPPNVERARLVVENIVRDGKAAGDVLNRIRALFKQTLPNKLTLDLNDVIHEVCLLMASDFAAAGVSVQMELDRDLPPISGDQVQLQQVLVNLLHNAMDAMESIIGRPKLITIRSFTSPEGGAQVDINDAGVGIDDAERAFEPFVTTKEKGMGMGLAICSSIIDIHDGKVWAKRNEGYGTTFSFTLPNSARRGEQGSTSANGEHVSSQPVESWPRRL